MQKVHVFAVTDGWAYATQAGTGSERDFTIPVFTKLRYQARGRLAVLIKTNNGICPMCKSLIKTHIQRSSDTDIASTLDA